MAKVWKKKPNCICVWLQVYKQMTPLWLQSCLNLPGNKPFVGLTSEHAQRGLHCGCGCCHVLVFQRKGRAGAGGRRFASHCTIFFLPLHLFSDVLNFLRSSDLPPRERVRSVYKEAQYYSIGPLLDSLEDLQPLKGEKVRQAFLGLMPYYKGKLGVQQWCGRACRMAGHAQPGSSGALELGTEF